LNDKEIIRLYFDRNEQAIAETRKKYSTYLKSIAYGILKNREDAEECENDTYLVAWNNIPPASPNNLTAFLAKIIRNTSLSKLKIKNAKKRIRENDILPIDELYASLSDNSFPDAEISEKELGKLIDTFLRKLPNDERIIFIRRYWFSEDISIMSKNLGFTKSKIKTTLMRTRNKLRKYLEKEGIQI